jgi:hypothetical protein
VIKLKKLDSFRLIVEHRGAGPGCNTQEIGDKLARLRNEVAALEALESNLDQHKQVSHKNSSLAYCNLI